MPHHVVLGVVLNLRRVVLGVRHDGADVVHGGMMAVTARMRRRRTGVENVVRGNRFRVRIVAVMALLAAVAMRRLVPAGPWPVIGMPAAIARVMAVQRRVMPAVIVQRAMRTGIAIMRPHAPCPSCSVWDGRRLCACCTPPSSWPFVQPR